MTTITLAISQEKYRLHKWRHTFTSGAVTMRHRNITTISVSIFLFTTSWSPPALPISPEPINAEELFARSGLAYRAVQMVDISFSTRVEMPNAEPGRRVTHYLLGEQGEAVIKIGSIMRVVANPTNIFAELPGHDDL